MKAGLRGLCLALFTHLLWSFALGDPIYAHSNRDLVPPLQDIVTWDEYSISVRGERILLLSGEFHPFRLPSPGLWLDVFQKVRALGFSAVSFYVNWALLEGEQGHIRVDGVFALEQFFDAAHTAGIYLIARPGPYINAEVSGGGFPGWLQRLEGNLKSTDQSYLDALTPYILKIGSIVANSQITNGGPVILVQPENANNLTITGVDSACLEKEYMRYVEEQYRKAGIVVPFISNDAFPMGNFAPGTGTGAVDIYSFDFYPLAWSTSHSPFSSPLSTYNYSTHEQQSSGTPFSISEFQGGAPDAWGGVGVETSAAHIGYEFERVFYKLNYGYRAAIQSLYMIFGGTNWGNLGHPGGYTSYDVGAAIKEDRQVTREKYSELKLQAGFLQSSPAYLTTHPENGSYGIYTDSSALATTRLTGNHTNFYVVRHGLLTSSDTTSYNLRVNTSVGTVTIPQLGGSLTLHGRDSKIHVVDYDVGGINLIYSTAEIFTWKKAGAKSVVVIYGGEDEIHEFAVPCTLGWPSKIEGGGLNVKQLPSTVVVQWSVGPGRRVVHFGGSLELHLLWRNEAYNYWVLDLPAAEPLRRYISPSRDNMSVIVKAGYLVRTADISGETLYLTGDVNATTEVEVIAAPTHVNSIFFNAQRLETTLNAGRLDATVMYNQPNFTLPDLTKLTWHYFDSLPEIQPLYDDSAWASCNHTTSHNPRNLSTPTSLYSSDYGFNTGSLLYRGTFISNGSESSLYILTEGGFAYSHSIWLNSRYLTSWSGSPADMFYNQTVSLTGLLQPGESYVITVLIDHLGNDENFPANGNFMKDPRGILDYNLVGREKTDVVWKITGNLGGEQYRDVSRGPLNEGALYAERQGFHLPGAPIEEWEIRSPFQGVDAPGVGFFATTFDLHIPLGYDIPISVVFSNTSIANSSAPAKFRSQLFVNGWQFGKYINNIGPQTRFPVPEGIWNYNGSNYLALTIWGMEKGGVKLAGLQLSADVVVQSGYAKPSLVQGEYYKKRLGSY
ncbi:beta-galactosidase protein [Rutstroemia sp. NJR-2017a BBW]|nr:beta-galactosidase protein [Rutstroemia sp. NJR-2017a BBW]